MITRLAFHEGNNGGSTDFVDVSITNCEIDNEIVAAAAWYGTQTISSITLTGESNPSALDSPHTGGPDNARIQWTRAKCTSSGTKTLRVTLTSLPASFVVIVWRISGQDLTSPVDGATVGASGTSSTSSVDKTTNYANDALFAMGVQGSLGLDLTWAAAYTAESVTNGYWYESGAYDIDAGVAGTKTISGTLDTSSQWVISAIAIRQAVPTAPTYKVERPDLLQLARPSLDGFGMLNVRNW